MSQTGYSKVQIYSSSTASNTPSASNLTNDTNGSELGINITDGKLFYKDNSGTVQVMATKGTGPIGGSNTQVQYNSSGALAGSSNLTFDGTTLTANTLSVSTSTTTPIVQSSGSLLLKTNGTTTAVTINTSQQVMLGTISPINAGTITILKNGTTSNGIVIQDSNATGGNQLYFNNSSGTNIGTLNASATGLTWNLGTNGGVVFGNSSALTNSTLNDYETGTWTPTYTFAGGNGTAVFNTSLASYTKIGNTVTLNLYFDMTIGTASGIFSISNVPFSTSARVACSVLWDGGGAASNVITAELVTTSINFDLTPQSTSYSSGLQASNMNSHPYPRISVTYKTSF